MAGPPDALPNPRKARVRSTVGVLFMHSFCSQLQSASDTASRFVLGTFGSLHFLFPGVQPGLLLVRLAVSQKESPNPVAPAATPGKQAKTAADTANARASRFHPVRMGQSYHAGTWEANGEMFDIENRENGIADIERISMSA
ncbi:MAG: hypothetical protein IJ678_09395 [Kiritimatiellae bacterium]|nr:hypothetical protein [Kiritimatiellia bacterium]